MWLCRKFNGNGKFLYLYVYFCILILLYLNGGLILNIELIKKGIFRLSFNIKLNVNSFFYWLLEENIWFLLMKKEMCCWFKKYFY